MKHYFSASGITYAPEAGLPADFSGSSDWPVGSCVAGLRVAESLLRGSGSMEKIGLANDDPPTQKLPLIERPTAWVLIP